VYHQFEARLREIIRINILESREIFGLSAFATCATAYCLSRTAMFYVMTVFLYGVKLPACGYRQAALSVEQKGKVSKWL
jgi:hypothetical protein